MNEEAITEAQRAELTEMVRRLRAVAEPVGSLHSYWDNIFDIEAKLNGKEMHLNMTADELIAIGKKTLEGKKK